MPPPCEFPLPTEFAAVGAVLTVDHDRVTITRKGQDGSACGGVRVREISLSAIRAVELKRPGMTPGYLRLNTSSSLPAGVDLAYHTGGRYDDDTVLLSRRHFPAFEGARALLEALITQRSEVA